MRFQLSPSLLFVETLYALLKDPAVTFETHICGLHLHLRRS
jgi:hypothetical protein